MVKARIFLCGSVLNIRYRRYRTPSPGYAGWYTRVESMIAFAWHNGVIKCMTSYNVWRHTLYERDLVREHDRAGYTIHGLIQCMRDRVNITSEIAVVVRLMI